MSAETLTVVRLPEGFFVIADDQDYWNGPHDTESEAVDALRDEERMAAEEARQRRQPARPSYRIDAILTPLDEEYHFQHY